MKNEALHQLIQIIKNLEPLQPSMKQQLENKSLH